MNDTTHFYLTAAALALALAMQMTYFCWRRKDRRIAFWVAASWAFCVSDILFLFHLQMPVGLAEVLPTILVTGGYCFILFGAQQWAGRRPSYSLLWILALLHGIGIYFFFRHSNAPHARMIYNRIVWLAPTLATLFFLGKASPRYQLSLNSPAAVVGAQAAWLSFRIIVAAALSGAPHPRLDQVVQYLEYANIVLFDTTLFASVLLAQLDLRIDEFSHARAEVATLSRLLPVCAWCKQVRNDDGYWSELTDYLERKNMFKITHGICQDCAEKHVADIQRL
jgi:hypothetical protein